MCVIMRIDEDSSAYSESFKAWWRHQMETYSALLAICAGNSPVPGEFLHKGKWHGALIFFFICIWINGWENNREAGDLRRHHAHHDVILMGSGVYQLGVPQGQGDSSAPSTTDPLIGSFCLVTTDGRLRTDRRLWRISSQLPWSKLHRILASSFLSSSYGVICVHR